MSVVTLEQETFAVLTELADEEINGIVGGGKGPDVDTKTKVGVKAKGENVQISTQVGTAVSFGGDAKVYQSSNQEIDNSRDRAIIKYY